MGLRAATRAGTRPAGACAPAVRHLGRDRWPCRRRTLGPAAPGPALCRARPAARAGLRGHRHADGGARRRRQHRRFHRRRLRAAAAAAVPRAGTARQGLADPTRVQPHRSVGRELPRLAAAIALIRVARHLHRNVAQRHRAGRTTAPRGRAGQRIAAADAGRGAAPRPRVRQRRRRRGCFGHRDPEPCPLAGCFWRRNCGARPHDPPRRRTVHRHRRDAGELPVPAPRVAVLDDLSLPARCLRGSQRQLAADGRAAQARRNAC